MERIDGCYMLLTCYSHAWGDQIALLRRLARSFVPSIVHGCWCNFGKYHGILNTGCIFKYCYRKFLLFVFSFKPILIDFICFKVSFAFCESNRKF